MTSASAGPAACACACACACIGCAARGDDALLDVLPAGGCGDSPVPSPTRVAAKCPCTVAALVCRVVAISNRLFASSVASPSVPSSSKRVCAGPVMPLTLRIFVPARPLIALAKFTWASNASLSLGKNGLCVAFSPSNSTINARISIVPSARRRCLRKNCSKSASDGMMSNLLSTVRMVWRSAYRTSPSVSPTCATSTKEHVRHPGWGGVGQGTMQR